MHNNTDYSVIVDDFKQMVSMPSWKLYIDMLRDLLEAVNIEILDGKSVSTGKLLEEKDVKDLRNRRLVILEFIEFVPRFIKNNSKNNIIDIELDPYDKPKKLKSKM